MINKTIAHKYVWSSSTFLLLKSCTFLNYHAVVHVLVLFNIDFVLKYFFVSDNINVLVCFVSYVKI